MAPIWAGNHEYFYCVEVTYQLSNYGGEIDRQLERQMANSLGKRVYGVS